MPEPVQAQTTQAPPPRKVDPQKPEQNPANTLPQKAAEGSKPPAPTLPANRLRLAETAVRHYHIDIPAQHQPKDISEPTYWVHHAKSLKAGDKLDCVSESGAWECTLRVVAKGDTWARMRLLSHYEAISDETSIPINEQYRIDYIPGAGNGHRVIHKESRAIIADKLGSRDEAIRARDAHIDMMKRKA